MTKHRQLIHRIIQEADDHLTADQIYFLAKQEMPSIAIGTVYRNLNLMVKDEEIRRVQLAGEPDRFDRALLPMTTCSANAAVSCWTSSYRGFSKSWRRTPAPRSYPMI